MRIRNQKGDKLVKLVTFFIVEFILQDGEIGDFHQFDLTSVLLLPASQDGSEQTLGQVCPENRAYFQSQACQSLFLNILGEPSLDGFVYHDT